jgi:phosphonate transport system substrate-binding protein
MLGGKMIFRKFAVFLTVLCLLAVLAGPSGAADKFVLGILPEQNIVKQLERYKSLREYLSKGLDKDVQIKVLPKYEAVDDELKAGLIDGAIFGSFMFLVTAAKVNLEPLVRPEYEGISTYKGYIFVRKDSGIKDYKDMRGKRIALVDRATTAGYIFPLAYLKERGIKDVNAYWGRQIFTGSHDSAILTVLNRKAEIGAAKDTIYKKLARENPRIDGELMVIVEQKGHNPENTVAVRRNLPYKEKLKQLFLDLDKVPQGEEILKALGADRYIVTADKDFDELRKLIRTLGINLRDYDMTGLR